MRIWQQTAIWLARNSAVKDFMQSRSVMSELSQRFVGGRNGKKASARAGSLKSENITASLFYLGEYVKDAAVIRQTVEELLAMMALLNKAGLDVHVSVDPTQIGFHMDSGRYQDHAFELARAVKTASANAPAGTRNLLMLDMEDSGVTQATMDLLLSLKAASLPVAVTLQAYLFRTRADLEAVMDAGGAVRLVKGAFAEGKNIAFTRKEDIDANFLKLAGLMLSEKAKEAGFYPVFGTHDHTIIRRIIPMAKDRGWKKNRYEFEMLYGVRNNYQKELVSAGEPLRLYLPFGTDWWPYAVRRVGESPKNARFLIRSFFGR